MNTTTAQLSEHQIQAQIIAYFNQHYPNHRKCLFHVQQKASNALEGARFKTLGVTAGVSDLILLAPNGITYFLELKDDKGKQSDHQKAFQQQAESLGHIYRIIRSLSEFQTLLSTIPY